MISETTNTMNSSGSQYLFIESQLMDRSSHHTEYLKCILDGAKQKNIDTHVVCNRSATADIKRAFAASAVLASVSGKELDGIGGKFKRHFVKLSNTARNSVAIFHQLRKARKRVAIVVPTAWTLEIFALLPSLIWFRRKIQSANLIFIPQLKSTELESKKTKLLSVLARAANWVHPRIRFFAETKVAREAFAKITNCEFKPIAHPIYFETTFDEKAAKTRTPQAVNRTDTPVIFGCYGFARYEQGIDVLQAALNELLDRNPDLNIHVFIKWSKPFAMPDGSVAAPDAHLESTGKVTFIKEVLSDAPYYQQLRKTDCIVFPYRPESYAARMSRVFLEACCLGIPTIVSKGTNQWNISSKLQAGIGVAAEDPAALAHAIESMAAGISGYREKAKAVSALSRRMFSPVQFWQDIQETGWENELVTAKPIIEASQAQ